MISRSKGSIISKCYKIERDCRFRMLKNRRGLSVLNAPNRKGCYFEIVFIYFKSNSY